jgi:hypothetical protein
LALVSKNIKNSYQDLVNRAPCRKVKEITYWNYDKVPSEADQLKRALHWMELAKVSNYL